MNVGSSMGSMNGSPGPGAGGWYGTNGGGGLYLLFCLTFLFKLKCLSFHRFIIIYPTPPIPDNTINSDAGRTVVAYTKFGEEYG
jgi:hypothetical protein